VTHKQDHQYPHVSSDGDSQMFDWLGTPYVADRYYSAAKTMLLTTNAVEAKLDGQQSTVTNTVGHATVTNADASRLPATNPVRYPGFDDKLSGV
jgi:hypothetical protein